MKEKNSHIWERDPDNFYIEPEWCSSRLFDEEVFVHFVHDPACGTGRIVDAALGHGLWATGSDIVSRVEGENIAVKSFLEDKHIYDNIVSNPPFGKDSQAFIEHALSHSIAKVAMLMPTVWMNSKKRGEWLETTPLKRVWLLSPRPSMPPGKLVLEGLKAGGGTVDYSWFVWEHGHKGPPELRFLRK